MYFDIFRTEKEIKKRYRTLAKLLHPDTGGDKIIMQEVNEYYNKALDRVALFKISVDNINWGEKKQDKETDFAEQEQINIIFERQLKKVNSIIDYSKTNNTFNKKFVISLLNQLQTGRMLSERQEQSVDRIIRTFKI